MKLQEYISQHYSSKSVSRYLRQIDQFKIQQGDKAEQSKYQDILEYISSLRERKLHPKSLKNHLHSIKIYFRYLVEMNMREDHPCEHLQLKDQINKSIIVESLYTKEELEILYQESIKQNTKENTNSQDKIIIGLLIYQALTITELIELKIKDVNLEEGSIRIQGNENKLKNGNKSRTLYLQSKQILLIHEHIKDKKAEENLIQIQDKKLYGSYVNRLLKRITNKHYSPQKIRQSVIANLLKENKDIRIVQEFAGHRKTGSTEAYKRTGWEELKTSIEKYHPLQ